MRTKRTSQISIFDRFAEHEIGRELAAMSHWLDAHPKVLDGVSKDLRLSSAKATGRCGMSVESVLRCGLLKQHRQLSYKELAFHLLDSASFQAFARLPVGFVPKKSALQANIGALHATTWEAINQAVLCDAKHSRVESGKMMRIDSTVTQSNIHEPSDSTLLWDAVRVMVKLMRWADKLRGGQRLAWHNHSRVAKKRARAIHYTKGRQNKVPLYKELVRVSEATLAYLQQAFIGFEVHPVGGQSFERWRAQVVHYTPLIQRVIEQTHRRVFNGESVPAKEKLFSLFEEHTDIVIKGSRDIHYGHKLNLTSGKSGLIMDLVIEEGNPADAERFMPMLERHITFYGYAPRQVAGDGGYASGENVKQAKAKGVKDVAFHKKRGLRIEQMVKSTWVYRKLRNFRAGIEAGISCLKRAYGLARCTWKGIEHFRAYVWSSVVAHNLALLTRLKPA
jgi:IS5 family transposase